MKNTSVHYIYEPSRLILTWRSHAKGASSNYFTVAELIKHAEFVEFKYLLESDDYKKARQNGFSSFPGFRISNNVKPSNDLEIFIKRLPPKTREDYHLYLAQNRLPEDFSGSDFSLLSYTGGRLPSDSFVLVPDLHDLTSPTDILLDIHGLAYHIEKEDVKSIPEGSLISFIQEPDNSHDSNAIAIYLGNRQLGYISRIISKNLAQALNKFDVSGVISKTIVTPYVSRIVLMVSVR